MHKLGRCFASNDSAKKARLLHRCNLALPGLLLCTSLLAGAHSFQDLQQDSTKSIELLSYEGQKVTSVELAGQPDLNAAEMAPLVAQHAGEDFSAEKIQRTISALRNSGKFQDVELDLRPEQEGVRVVFILQPAIYFGMYQFPGAERFPYNRLVVAANYITQEPYSTVDIDKAKASLLTFLQRNGYFEAEVHPEVQLDRARGLANVNFNVTLNRRAKFGNIIIQGATEDEAEHLISNLRSLRARISMAAIRENKDYSLKTLENATQFLESHLQKDNHLAALVRLVGADYNPQTNRADIVFNIQPGPLVHVHVEGAHLWPWTKRKLLPIYQQTGLAPELVQEGRQNLLQTFREKGFFDVDVETETSARPDGIFVVYRVTKGQRKKIQDVAFIGNNSFGEEELEQQVNVRKAGILTKGSYDERSVRMLEAFYQSKGFNQVKVSSKFDTEDGRVIITFIVNEGPQDLVQSFRVEGNDSVPLDKLAPDGLNLGPGQPFSQKNIDGDRSKIMSHYLETGYLTATFRADTQPVANEPHRFQVVYNIHEGPQVKTGAIVTVGNNITHDRLIGIQTRTLEVGQPLTERDIYASESRLYTAGVFDWAEISPRRQITSQNQEDVIVKVHEKPLNTINYGFGYEVINRGGSIPSGTVALPGLPAVLLPSNFQTNQVRVHGPRVNLQYTRNNIRGKAETFTAGGFFGPLNKQVSLSFINPHFRWTDWAASLQAFGEVNKTNPIFVSNQVQAGFQFQKPISYRRGQQLFVRYTLSRINLSDLTIPELVPQEDLRTRLSTLAVAWVHDTRDNPLDASTGVYRSAEIDLNPSVLGSNVNFAKLLGQAAAYKKYNNFVWANSVRVGFAKASSGSHVPISQRFFSGGGSTLRGFPLNGAGPQTTVPVCSNPADPATCSLVRVPTGGNQLLIINSELRFPVPMKKGLTFAAFYDGGNVFGNIGVAEFRRQYTNSVGVGVRYATLVGPIRVDIGRNLNPIPGIKATQIFITLGQAF